MFNLEEQIRNWRRQMVASGIKSAETLDELEVHLREEMENQVRSGKSASNAFQAAVLQLGKSVLLGAEFSKITPTAKPPCAKYLSGFAFISAGLIAINLAPLLPDIAAASAGHALAVALMLGIMVYLLTLPFCFRRLPSLQNRVVAHTLNIGSFLVCFWILLALLDALHIVQARSDEVVAMIFWSLVPALFATLLAYDAFSLRIPARGGSMQMTPSVAHVLELARGEATRLRHDFIGTEHVLLGLLRSESGLAVEVLKKSGLVETSIRTEIEKLVGPGSHDGPRAELPFTPRAKSVLALAGQEAAAMNRSAIGSEHVLLGLVLEPEGVAGLVLRNLGIQPDQTRLQILRLMDPDNPGGPAPAPAS